MVSLFFADTAATHADTRHGQLCRNRMDMEVHYRMPSATPVCTLKKFYPRHAPFRRGIGRDEALTMFWERTLPRSASMRECVRERWHRVPLLPRDRNAEEMEAALTKCAQRCLAECCLVAACKPKTLWICSQNTLPGACHSTLFLVSTHCALRGSRQSCLRVIHSHPARAFSSYR